MGFRTACPLMWDTSISVDSPADDAFEVLLTDCAADVVKFLQNKRPYSEVVYLGEMSEVKDMYAMLLDVWPREEPSEFRKQRIEKLLKELADAI